MAGTNSSDHYVSAVTFDVGPHDANEGLPFVKFNVQAYCEKEHAIVMSFQRWHSMAYTKIERK